MNNGSNQQQGGATAILNLCRRINEDLQGIRQKREGQLVALQNALLDSSTGKEDQEIRQNLDYMEQEIKNGFEALREKLKKAKQTPGSGDSRVQTQIDLASRNIQQEIEQYRKAQVDFKARLKDQVQRRYEIANPEASPEEVRQGVEMVLMGQEQSFQVSGNRTRQANDAKKAAMERSLAIRKIEQDMEELVNLSKEIGQLVLQQETAVEQINEDAGNVATNVQIANKQLDSAIVSARNARKWKWYALGIIVLIIIIIIIIVVVVKEVEK
ncbi:hypothetical protein ASPZODRAFT_55866 [Penicilliopsis zonata CBS 506.65]|uniref:t-SNARE coiled-coil homology domain-containing protein n=1 Tax=Penicilliopsis zonata CBS 506.65 TaxID=1073090 RepID=A0A1L9SX35_9EURO|nr:hypothetical protein ASPZODRAFT_55866 [Penicilliopsis zonata CBS 506.65]OJJ51744.1 hypothetical protein ASPZODRAFT_55866 [Penicilliopsis zonata CBS 506.65]